MDHLRISEAHRSRGIIVPYLGLAPRYDYKGLIGFPERHGYHSEILSSYSEESFSHRENEDPPPVSREFIGSLFQEWLWFGIMHEFAIVCGRHLDLDEFIKTGTDGQRTVNTEFLLYYVRTLSIDLLIESEVPLDLEVGDLVSNTYLDDFSDDSSDVFSINSASWGEDSDSGSHSRDISRSTSAEVPLQDVHSETRSRSRSLSLSANALDKFPNARKIAKCWSNLRYGFEGDGAENLWGVTELRRADYTIESVDMPGILARCQDIPLVILAKNVHIVSPQPGSRYSRFSLCMQKLRRTTRLALSHLNPVIRFEIALSIDLLHDSLSRALEMLFRIDLPYEADSSYYDTQFKIRMKDENWCLARTESVLGIDLSSMYMKFLMPSYESNSHKNCTSRTCAYLSHDVSRLHAQHKLDVCDGKCQMLVFDEKKLIGILKDGGIPGISRNDRKGATVGFEIVDITGRPYIAISHVWSHGLGNPTQNALPLCQVEGLFKSIRPIGSPDTILWIDTLVVPVDPTYKLLAITKLRIVYGKAYGVLVIDRHLTRVGEDLLERQIQVLCSEWMRRLWTLQEGRLAARLYLQFRDEAVLVQDLFDADVVHNNDSVFDYVSESASEDLITHFVTHSRVASRFQDLVIDLAHRSATVPTDEPICLATLLGLPLEAFQSYPTIVDIYRSLQEIPPSLLFLQNTRLNLIGFRWAPSTFLNQEFEAFGSSPCDDTASLMEGGLRIKRSCIMFKDDLYYDFADELLVREAPGITFIVSDYNDTPLTEGAKFLKPALILNSIGSTFRLSIISAVLVDDLVLKDGIYYCRWRRRLLIQKWNESEHENEVEVTDDNVYDGEFLEDVTFCVD